MSMSAEVTQVASEELETKHNGRDVETLEPITHDYDKVGQLVIGECTACATGHSRRLLRRDYDIEDDFQQSLAVGDDDWLPTVIYRYCDECGREESHLVV